MKYLHIINTLGTASSIEIRDANFLLNQLVTGVRAMGFFMDENHYIPVESIALIFVSDQQTPIMTSPPMGRMQ